MLVNAKPFEIFCGLGGVGKTTLAASRALYLASQGKKVLLLTIDPAKRLKQVLGMSEEKAGDVETISIKLNESQIQFDAMLMSPTKTLSKIAHDNNLIKDFENHIIKILGQPYSGMNEIFALVEIELQYERKIYDYIIVDTPPGKHFIDFLNGVNKIKQFFGQTILDMFIQLERKDVIKNSKTSDGIFSKLLSSGVKKLLNYLEFVTGKEFVEEFINAIAAIYKSRSTFLKALTLQDQFKDSNKTNWFLVTSSNHRNSVDMIEMQKTTGFKKENTYLVINKCLNKYFSDWENENDVKLFASIKKSLTYNEEMLTKKSINEFNKIIYFKQAFSIDPMEHILELKEQW